MNKPITIGFPCMRVEAGERRDYLPKYIARLEKFGASVVLEHGYGQGMGFSPKNYQKRSTDVRFVSHEEAYHQDYVFVLRCPADDDIKSMRPGACLISMLHYPTRPIRTKFIRALGLEAISLDSLKDDSGRRLIENLRAVAWNGLEAAFKTLQAIYPSPGFKSPLRKPIQVTLMGSGGVGVHAVQAAIRYGNPTLWREMIEHGIPGVQVTVIDIDTTRIEESMLDLLSKTDILVDATQRTDPTVPVIPNHWIEVMPHHAILLDLSVDPYECDYPLVSVKGIEGIPHGNLDQYVFAPNDPVYESVPDCVPTIHRRYAISCYSWPGIHPKECMRVYGKQLAPIFRTLIRKGGTQNIDGRGRFFERAIARARLSCWEGD
jgi:alanine dehydrogenase